MTHDRAEAMNRRSGLLGWFDTIRYKEIYRQVLGLALIGLCAWATRPGNQPVIAGLSVATFGQLFRIFAAGTIFKNRRLATNGAYALVRHPLYLGNILILGGFCLAGGQWWVAAVVAVFFAIWYPAAVRYEDRKLEHIFGEDWREWRRRTPAVFPLRFRARELMQAQWSAGQSLIRNGELYITIYLAACAGWLWIAAKG